MRPGDRDFFFSINGRIVTTPQSELSYNTEQYVLVRSSSHFFLQSLLEHTHGVVVNRNPISSFFFSCVLPRGPQFLHCNCPPYRHATYHTPTVISKWTCPWSVLHKQRHDIITQWVTPTEEQLNNLWRCGEREI